MPGEADVLRLLGEAFNAFAALPRQHPADLGEFSTFVHGAQNIVMARFAQRYEASGLTPVKVPVQ